MSSKFLLGFCADSSDVHRRGAGANTRPGPASSANHLYCSAIGIDDAKKVAIDSGLV
jgi:hypothetical protein